MTKSIYRFIFQQLVAIVLLVVPQTIMTRNVVDVNPTQTMECVVKAVKSNTV